jgi:hypothetical protein
MRRIFIGISTLALVFSFLAFGQQELESGTFFFQLDEDAGLESFTLEELADGNLKLTADFEALSEQLVFDFGTDRLFTQDVVFTPDLQLVSYSLNSETDQGSFEVNVVVDGGIASINSVAQTPGEAPIEQNRDLLLEDEVITTGIAASQFLLMQLYINQKLDLAVDEDLLVTAFDPSNITSPFVELTILRLPNVIVEDVNSRALIESQRYQITQNEFAVEIVSCAVDDVANICDEVGRFLGFISSTATLAGVILDNDPNGSGALVSSIADGSFADQAGLQDGDLITHINGESVDSRRELQNEVRFLNPSLPITLTIDRNGEILDIEVRLSGSFLQVFRFDLFEGGFSILGEV